MSEPINLDPIFGTIVALTSDGKKVTDQQPCELRLDSVIGDVITFSIHHKPLTVLMEAVAMTVTMYDESGEVVWTEPWSSALLVGDTINHEPRKS